MNLKKQHLQITQKGCQTHTKLFVPYPPGWLKQTPQLAGDILAAFPLNRVESPRDTSNFRILTRAVHCCSQIVEFTALQSAGLQKGGFHVEESASSDLIQNRLI